MLKKFKVLLMLVLSIFIVNGFAINSSAITSPSNATNVSLEKSITGTIAKEKEEHWYKFTTTSNKSFYQFTYKNLSIGSEYYNPCNMTIYTMDMEEVYSGRVYKNSEKYTQINAPKNTTYYIKVTGSLPGNYRFSMKELKDDHPDTMAESTSISLNKSYTNYINAESKLDEDWFKFTTTSNKSFYRFSYKNLSMGSEYYNPCMFTIYTEDMEEIADVIAYKNQDKYKDLKLDKNTTYYIKVTGHLMGSYRISVTENKDDAPDTLESSKTISINNGYAGSIDATDDLDTDWYKFKTSNETDYKFSYKNIDIDGTYYSCSFEIYTKHGELKAEGYVYQGNSSSKDIKLSKNTTYYIKVSSKEAGRYNFSVTTKNPVAKTTGFKSTSNTSSSIKLAWSKVSNASGYKIYRATSKNGTYKHIKTVKGNSNLTYNDTKLSSAKTYYYKIRAYKTINSTSYNGSYSAILTANTKPSTPSITVTSPKSKQVKVSWKSVSSGSGYEVYRATSKKGTYKKIKTTSSLSYTNSGLTKGKTYYYKVRAYKSINGKKVYSAYSSVKNIKVK